MTNSGIGPEVEQRLAQFHAKNGQVLFGGKLLSDADRRYALPDNLGGDAIRRIASPLRGVEVENLGCYSMHVIIILCCRSGPRIMPNAIG